MDIDLFAKALLSTRKFDDIFAEFGEVDDPGIILEAGADLEALLGSKILPTKGVCKYLASDDELDHKIIDNMELALERDYGVKAPYYITSMRSTKNGRHQVDYFYLGKEV